MNVARFIETLLVRDVLSYFVPGMLIALVLKIYQLDFGGVDLVKTAIADSVGETGQFWVFAFIAYVIGYLASTLLFYLEGTINRLTKFQIPLPSAEVMKSLKFAFGDWVEKADGKYLSRICQDYIETQDANFYFQKIDRLLLLRNLEMGVATVFLVWSIALFLSANLYGFLPLLATILLLMSGRRLNYDTKSQIFRSFYVLYRAEALRITAK